MVRQSNSDLVLFCFPYHCQNISSGVAYPENFKQLLFKGADFYGQMDDETPKAIDFRYDDCVEL
jgi:hypothetical protein